jgi:hypothetical protein
MSTTWLSIAVAFLIGSIELVNVLHDNAGWVNPVTTAISGVNLNKRWLRHRRPLRDHRGISPDLLAARHGGGPLEDEHRAGFRVSSAVALGRDETTLGGHVVQLNGAGRRRQQVGTRISSLVN